MELLTLENDAFVRCNVTYNKDDMDHFLNEIVDKYGCFYQLQNEKAMSENKFLMKYDECRGINPTDVHIDNTRIHKGRHRVLRKQPKIRYTFNLTGINYPEIYWTIKRFLNQKVLDFSVFAKYINADAAVAYDDVNYYIMEGRTGYKRDSINNLQEIVSNSEKRKQYIDEKINSRLRQSECLKEFYNLLVIEKIESKPEINDSLSSTYESLYTRLRLIPGFADNDKYLSEFSKFISKRLPASINRELLEKAKINSEVINTIINSNLPKVKTK